MIIDFWLLVGKQKSPEIQYRHKLIESGYIIPILINFESLNFDWTAFDLSCNSFRVST